MRWGEADQLRKVIVCSPGVEYFSVSALKQHNIIKNADPAKTLDQHILLKAKLQDFGCEVFDLPELQNHPNSVFTRDTALCTPFGFVKLKMGLSTRRSEESWVAEKLIYLGVNKVAEIKGSGTAEGGDIILAEKVAFVGRSSRTNTEGVKQIKAILSSLGYEVRVADIPLLYLHIGGAVSLVRPDTVMHCSGVFPPDFFRGFNRIEVPDDSFVSGNVISLGNNEVIADPANNITVGKLLEHGITVHEIDLSEFAKGIGGPSCLILPVERSK
jgi:dimethylargininase